MSLLLSPGTDACRKHVHLLATGGTIAGAAADSRQTIGYKAASLPAQALVDAVPGLQTLAQVSVEQFLQIASEDIAPVAWLLLAKRVNALLAMPGIDGIVITHGTDTLEETAYFLQLTVKSNKPVVLVGAMRPATALSADGPLNLYNAVLVAVEAQSYGKGVLVVMDDIILSARDAQKMSTYRTSAFQRGEFGTLGTVEGGYADYAFTPLKKHTMQSVFDISALRNLPEVPIVYLYAGAGTRQLEHALQDGAKGVVLACMGNGSFPTSIREYIVSHALNTPESVPLVRASRIPIGAVARNGEVDDDAMHTIPAYSLNPQKARVLLMLGLAMNMNKQRIAEVFTEY